MREADRRECEAIATDPARALWESVERSERSCAVLDPGGCPIAISGISSVSVIWLLGTDGVESNARQFLRMSRDGFAWLVEGHDRVWNYVDVRNTVHIRWLEWLGFNFEGAATKIGSGLFRYFWRDV
jgi:hypothetical protein